MGRSALKRALFFATLAAGAPVHAQDANCFAAVEPAAKIDPCTRLLENSALSSETRALAFAARADAFATQGVRDRALADYDAALALLPSDIAALVGRGRMHEGTDVRKAEADYTAAITADPLGKSPATGEAYARRGGLRLARGDTAAGIADLGEARRLNPRDPGPFRIRGEYFLKTGAIEQAIAELSAALALKTDDAQSLVHRGTAYAGVRNYTAAIADFSAALASEPRKAAALEARGVARLQSGDAAGAVADFSALLTLNPDDLAASFLRANANLQAGELKAAESDYTAVLSKRPGDIEALMGRALAREFSGDTGGAEADLSAILNLDPMAGQALATRGYVRVMAGKFGDAAKDLTRAMALPNAPPDLALWRFVAEGRTGTLPVAMLADAAKGFPGEAWPKPIARYFLGELSGDELLAAARGNEAPGRLCEAYFFLGQAALLANQPAEAAKLFQAALATGMTRFTEYAGAAAELDRLGAR